MIENRSIENEYLELISGYLMNHFYEYDSYEEGVESAVEYVNSDSEYLAEMKAAFEYALESDFPKNCLRDIVRGYGNYFVSDDKSAKRRLTFIYEDTILQKEHDELIDWDALADEDNEEEIVFIPGEMKIDELVNDIFNTSLDFKKRVTAAIAYSKSGDEQIFENMLKSLEDKESGIRAAFVSAFASLEDSRVIEHLLNILKSDPDERVRKNVVFSLASYHDKRVIEAMVEQIEVESSESVKRSICHTLGKYDFNVVEPLLKILFKNIDYDKYINSVLRSIKDIRCSKLLVPFLKDKSPLIRARIADYLGSFDTPETIEALNEALNDSDDKVRHYARVSLNSIAYRKKLEEGEKV